MYHQVPASVCWTTSARPKTMVPIGTEVLGLLCSNIVVFHHLKTETKLYFKGDSPSTSAGISLLTGLTRYPIFAIAEAVLRPRIFVMRYPEMDKLKTIYSPDVLSYVDLVFSEHGFLAGLTGYPSYRLRLWNYRNGVEMASTRTHAKSAKFSLYPIKSDVEVVVQYAYWHKQIITWQLCRSPDQTTLNELATIELNNDFSKSNLFPICYWDDNYAYVVNDYGDVFWVDVAPMALRPAWSTPSDKNCSHSIFYNKTGILVMNSEFVYFIKRRTADQRDWYVEWSIENPDGSLVKLVSDCNNNIYGATNLGQIQLFQQGQQSCTLKSLFANNFVVSDYTIIKGIKDEVVLILTTAGDLLIVDLIKMNTYSKINIDEACAICAHNVLPYVAVGTKLGRIHFLNYEKPRAPFFVATVFVENAAIKRLFLYDNCALVVDELNGVQLLATNFRLSVFQVHASLKPESSENWHLLDMNLLDEERALLFISEHSDFIMQYAAEAWLYRWSKVSFELLPCAIFHLPFRYRGFSVLQPCTNELVEIMAVRLESNVIDVLWLNNNRDFVIGYTLKTCHFTHINTIGGSKNILTADTQSLVVHFRSHKKSKFPYQISRPLLCTYMTKISIKIDECFNNKYLLVLYSQGLLLAFRLPLFTDCLKENKTLQVTEEEKQPILPYAVMQKKLKHLKSILVPLASEADKRIKEGIVQELQAIEKSMRELIDYDLSVNRHGGIDYRKFCLDHKWLDLLEEESRILCSKEREILLAAITDQSRIRDWIFDLIKRQGTIFSTKIRSLYSNITVASYTTRAPPQELLDRFELFRFYNMEPPEEEEEVVHDDDEDDELMGEEEEAVVERKALKRYVIEKGMQVYDHVLAKDFELQDINLVTFNQMYNEEAKLRIILVEALKAEFNKRFGSSYGFKAEILTNVNGTNADLIKIYNNMNCMLCLLKMDQFTPPTLSQPEWEMDENIQRILTVDDSEIKAINRRKKIVEAAAKVSKRMLLWRKEFWSRALLVMMDGVLEKLWEEEIKKTPFPPEFTLKKQEHEYNLEEQRLWRQYQTSLQILEQDRRKYLRILRENETKSHALKKHFILKLNEHVAEIDILKLKYDFAIKHERLRLLIMKLTSHKRIICRRRIEDYKNEINKLIDYISKYEQLLNFFERSETELKYNYENQQMKDRTLERQFKNQFLTQIPQQHLVGDMLRTYKRRPKLPPKVFATADICFEMAHRLVTKKVDKFPLSPELLEFLSFISGLDDPANCPAQIDQKFWEPLVRLRRHKLESELRLKGIGYQMNDVPKYIGFFNAELKKLKDTRAEKNTELLYTMHEYFDTVQNQSLEFILTKGQIEIAMDSMDKFNHAILMHVDDISDVNNLIKAAGASKIKSMQRVAKFRRQIIFTEWQHKVACSNIEYLRNMYTIIEKTKVDSEFLGVLRKWDKVKATKDTAYRVGILDEVTKQRLTSSRRQLEKMYDRIAEVKFMIEEKKRKNNELNTLIANAKVSVAYMNVKRDFMGEEKEERVKDGRMAKAIRFGNLMYTVKRDFAKILELQTIYRIINLRVNETLPPLRTECIIP